MSDAETAVEEWSIEVRSAELNVFNVLENPVHNFVVIIDPDGTEYELHGLCLDRETGKSANIGGHTDTIRVLPHSMPDATPSVCNTEIFRGTREEVLQKMGMAVDAGNFINQQNLPYDACQIVFGMGQNSNSVAHSLVEAMGLEFPEENERFWAPGHERILLPEGWQSAYADQPLSEQQMEYLIDIYYKEAKREVGAQAASDPMPDTPLGGLAGQTVSPDGFFFDRANPNAPYEPASLHTRIDHVDVSLDVAQDLTEEYFEKLEALMDDPRIEAVMEVIEQGEQSVVTEHGITTTVGYDLETYQMIYDTLNDPEIKGQLNEIASARYTMEAAWEGAMHMVEMLPPDQCVSQAPRVAEGFEAVVSRLPEGLEFLPNNSPSRDAAYFAEDTVYNGHVPSYFGGMHAEYLAGWIEDMSRDLSAHAPAVEAAPDPVFDAELDQSAVLNH